MEGQIQRAKKKERRSRKTLSSFRLEADKAETKKERRVTAALGVFKCITRLILRNTLLLIVPYLRTKAKVLLSCARPHYSHRSLPPLFCLSHGSLSIGRYSALVFAFDERGRSRGNDKAT